VSECHTGLGGRLAWVRWGPQSGGSALLVVGFSVLVSILPRSLSMSGGSIGVNFLQILGGSWPFPFPSPPLPSPPSPHLHSPPLRSRAPQIQLGVLGERCKLPQRGLGRRHSRNQIWCILALKSVIWWQAILMIFVKVN